MLQIYIAFSYELLTRWNVSRSADDANVFLVNDFQDPLQVRVVRVYFFGLFSQLYYQSYMIQSTNTINSPSFPFWFLSSKISVVLI